MAIRRTHNRKSKYGVTTTVNQHHLRTKKGKGKKVIQITKEGSLGGEGFFSKPEAEQKKILRGAVKKYGEMSVQGKMQAISTFSKKNNPKLSKKASELRTYVAKSFGKYYGEK